MEFSIPPLPPRVGKFTPMEKERRKTNLRGSGSAWNSEQAPRPFWVSVYKARGLGQSVHVNPEPLGDAFPHLGDMASVERPQSPDVSPCLGEGQSIRCGENLSGGEDGSWNVLTGISTPSPPAWVTSGKLFTSLASSFLICQTVLTLEEFLLK